MTSETSGELDELRKMVSELRRQIQTIVEAETKEKLIGSFLSKAKE